jgi:hypothetical protein
MHKTLVASMMLFSSVALAGGTSANDSQRQPPSTAQGQQGPAKRVDLVIALDTSSSMDGLIDAARAKLWDAVNLLAHAKPQPALRVGVISYGNDGYDARSGWVRKDADLTSNLDDVYAKLFALKTNGGSEYVARAVHDATTTMAWDQDPRTLKIIFVAGNEPANQDPKIPVEQALAEARQHNIFVNAIYCGTDSAWEASGWQKVAALGKGQFAAIDQNRMVAIATPMDAELARLSGELNQTYVGYGPAAATHAAQQAAMDRSAGGAGAPVAASRAAAKASALYRNDEWDLVDARASKKLKVAEMAPAALPAPVAALPPAEREKFLDQKAKDRAALQKRIQELSAQRDGYIAAERKRQKPAAQARTFDDAVNATIKTEAESAGLAF